MGTIGKLVREVEIKSGINLVYDIYKHKPNNSGVISPDKVQGCDFVSGQWGDPGSFIGTSSMVNYFNYDNSTCKFVLCVINVGDLLSSMLFKCNKITLLTKSDIYKYYTSKKVWSTHLFNIDQELIYN
uniref:Uncharacterized protein n=1 Tax=Lactuca sativa TaxID=4236 RepID=A0A9R1XLF1_LACSA|nr:hypothetical protein LSAT_V11C300116970 [Lactuca sativa]